LTELIVKIPDEQTVEKIMWLMSHFDKEGVEVLPKPHPDLHNSADLNENWRELGMSTHSNSGDHNQKVDAYVRFQDEKHPT
jgi:hypothetical protein